jgi:hypothetical protein
MVQDKQGRTKFTTLVELPEGTRHTLSIFFPTHLAP